MEAEKSRNLPSESWRPTQESLWPKSQSQYAGLRTRRVRGIRSKGRRLMSQLKNGQAERANSHFFHLFVYSCPQQIGQGLLALVRRPSAFLSSPIQTLISS